MVGRGSPCSREDAELLHLVLLRTLERLHATGDRGSAWEAKTKALGRVILKGKTRDSKVLGSD